MIKTKQDWINKFHNDEQIGCFSSEIWMIAQYKNYYLKRGVKDKRKYTKRKDNEINKIYLKLQRHLIKNYPVALYKDLLKLFKCSKH